jgi:hypothetical protein
LEVLEENEQEFKCLNNITWEVDPYNILNVLRESTKLAEKGCHPLLSVRVSTYELKKNFLVTVCILYLQVP